MLLTQHILYLYIILDEYELVYCMATSALKRKQSSVWTYFNVDESDDSIAWCIVENCSSKSRLVRRAAPGSDKNHTRQRDYEVI